MAFMKRTNIVADLRHRIRGAGDSRRTWAVATLFARLALAIGFLSAVADRFGLWGAPGTGNVAWGEYSRYLAYLHELAPYLSGGFLDAAGWLATAAETALGVVLLLGVAVRLAAWASTGVLLVFGLSMFVFSDPEAPFSASVFSAAGVALLLALAPAGVYLLALDRKPGSRGEQMIRIDNDMREIVAAARLSFVATVDPDGSPNLSPKGSVRVYDDQHLAFMDIASPATMANLASGSRIEINAIDFLRRRGYRFKGTAEVREPGDEVYEWLHSWLLDLNGPGYPANRAVLVRVDRILPVLSPAYTFGGAHEPDLTKSWSETYGTVGRP
jgi:predicted pyridoxine 5'-phosphate oxidase superfamily flavin-nucleotide-binding protein/uncharacterized membrane protein YphA (DoxX/SURF4 family)